MKKRRVVFVILGMVALVATVITLSVNVYHLYVEAEKAQKTAFTGNILTVGREIVQHINADLSRNVDKKPTIADDSAHTRNKQTFLFEFRFQLLTIMATRSSSTRTRPSSVTGVTHFRPTACFPSPSYLLRIVLNYRRFPILFSTISIRTLFVVLFIQSCL